jgi:hypothetical protein
MQLFYTLIKCTKFNYEKTTYTISLLFVLTCAKEDSQAPNLPPTQIVKQYALTASAGDGGSVTGGGTFASGTQVSLTATPSSGYSFSGWSNGSTANPLTVTLNSNTSITANFQVIVNSYTLTVTAGEGGSVSTEGGEYEEGTEVTITATPEEGYEFIGWSDGENSSERVITISSETSISANFQITPFVSKSPSYSYINQTTSKYLNQYYFQGYMTRDDHESISWIDSNVKYMIQENDAVYYDFDQNGTLDFFGFAYWSDPNNGEWGTNPGKYVLIKDFFLGNREKILFDTQLAFGGKMDLSDLDNDGQLDVLMYGQNVHQNSPYAYSSSLNEMPTEYIKIDTDLNFSSSFIGPVISLHDGSSGDVDNDGDVDIMLIPQNAHFYNYDREIRYPILLINNGLGQFTEQDAFDDNFNFTPYYTNHQEDYTEYQSIHYELFDLNNDGNLDLISGFWADNNNEYVNREKVGIDVFWGDGSGKFITTNSSKILPNNPQGYQYSPLGSTYFDYDYDGDLDLFLITTRAEDGNYVNNGGLTDEGTYFYENYFMYIFRNDNGDFVDVTSTSIDKNYDTSKTNFSHFYDLNFRDIDDDGDFDLIPSRTSGWFIFPQLNNLYWENINGSFFIKDDGELNYSVFD